MDLLSGSQLDQYASSALHTSRLPHRVLMPGANYSSVADQIEDRNAELIDDFASRRGMRRAGSAFGGDIFAAIPRFYRPQEWYKASHVPHDIHDDKQRFELYEWLDFFYRTHSLIPMLVDIFTRFPLAGMELESKDRKLTEFYKDIFFDRLDYEDFLVHLGREHWVLGQAFPLGHFHESLGVWESEELLDPTLVTVENYPLIGGQAFYIEPPEDLVEIAQKKEPKPMWALLQRNFPEIIPFLQRKERIPISDVLLKQVAFKANKRDLHGTPLLLRALRTLIHEEKLLAAQDAIAERMYAPMVLVKLGVQDMGEGRPPFLPGPGEVAHIRNEFDLALSSDFRLLVHHFGIDVQTIFGRETMPHLDADFDRIDRKVCAVFGINPSLLLGGAASQPYASSALQAEFLNQILRTYQKYLINHMKSRMKVVAEAQEHYDYEKRGDSRIPIMEEVVVFDPDTGEEKVEKRHKLLIPEPTFAVLDLRDEATQRAFMQALKAQGLPIPDQDLAMGMGFVFDESLEEFQREMIAKTVAQQQAKVKAYDILTAMGLPVPPDTRAEVEGAGLGAPAPGVGTTPDVSSPRPGEPIVMPPPPMDLTGPGMDNPAAGRDDQRGTFPEESRDVMGPQLPGVPGQGGLLGIPGAPTPAIKTKP